MTTHTVTYPVKATKIIEKSYSVTCPYCLTTHVHTLTAKEINMLLGISPYIESNYVYRTVDGCGRYEIVEIDE